MNEKNIGDKVWWATCSVKPITIDCPICFKNKEVTLILGNGEQIKVPCEYCVSGFEEPKGYTTEYQRISDVKEVTITGKEVTEDGSGKRIEYRFGCYILDEKNSFDTKEEAEKALIGIIKEYEDSELKRLEYKKRKNQTHFSWSLGYHRKKVKDAQRDIEYHSKKFKELKS